MLLEVLQQAGAGQYEQPYARQGAPKGYKTRSLKTRYGDLVLQIPQFLEFSFETQGFKRYSQVEITFVNVISS